MGESLKAHPILELGEPSKGGFMLPCKSVSNRAMYSPRGVFYDGNILVVADTGNHRVLIWFSLPEEDYTPADVVLGQRDFLSDSPNAGGNPEIGMYMPCGVFIKDRKLFVADSWNHRILVWETIPEENGKKPDYVIGQKNLKEVEPVKGLEAKGFFWCYGLSFYKDYLLVCDTGNRRIIGWKGEFDYWKEPDIIIGKRYNYQWPHHISSNGEITFIADAGLHRVVGYKKIPQDSVPEVVLGQKDPFHVSENLEMQSEKTLRFPYGVGLSDKFLAIADTGNHRVLVWKNIPERGYGIPADIVLGQRNFQECGENRWEGIKKDTLCWCYGVHVYDNLIFIADSGNNRIVVWKVG